MKRIILTVITTALIAVNVFSQGYKVGDYAKDFKLKNVDGKMVSMSDNASVKGYIVVFTCNHCPYAKAYEDRIIALNKKFAALGYPVIAINPNDPSIVPDDSYDNMVARAKEKNYQFPYLLDEQQTVYPAFGAEHTPHVYVLQKDAKGFKVQYIGAIDNNTDDASSATKKYVEDAVNALLAGKTPTVTNTRAVGCSIKSKRS